MKKSLVVAGLLLAGSSLMADIQPFVGIDLNKVDADVSTKLNGTVTYYGNSVSNLTIDESAKDTAVSGKIGVIIDNSHRTYLSYGKYSDDGGKLTNSLLNYDYLFKTSNEKYRPFVGIHIGQAKYENDNFEISKTGTAYGFQGGIIYDINNNVSLELGASYTTFNAEAKTPTLNASLYNGNLTLSNVNITSEVENASRISIGLNYKF